MNNSTPYTNSYHDNGQYCDLGIYGLPTWIITYKNKDIYDCTDWFLRGNKFASVNTMREAGIPIHDLKINVRPDISINYCERYLSKTIIYANFYFAPWSILNVPAIYINSYQKDIQWKQLNKINEFDWIHDYYYGTNYGTIWSAKNGLYLQGYVNNKNVDGNGYIDYKICFFNKHIAAHRVAAHFVYNPDPDRCKVVCHRDNNPRNNHYKNLYWGTNKDNMQQAIHDGRTPQCTPVLDRDTVQEIIRDFEVLYKNNPNVSKGEIYKKWQEKLEVTDKCIRESIIRYFGKEALTPKNTTNKAIVSETPILYNNCSIANDYNNTYEYAVLSFRAFRDIVITKDCKLYRCTTKKVNYFPMEDKSKWPSLEDLPNLEYIIPMDNNPRNQLPSIYNKYVNGSRSITVDVTYRLYFGDSPWYNQICGEDIQYAQMNTHSDYADMGDYYFMCSNGLIYSFLRAKYIAPKVKGSYLSGEYSYSLPTRNLTRTIKVLLEAFGFNVPDEATAKKWITSKVTSSTFF